MPVGDYSALDHPQVIQNLFHPRPEWNRGQASVYCENILIPVADKVSIGACFHVLDKNAPNILFFHGNGEIVSDYDDFGTIYVNAGINFFPVDYRGYGRSGGKPSVTAMMNDCHVIFDFLKQWLFEKGFTGKLIVMGRSLGSASALEIAFHHLDRFDALIIESGFAYADPLFRLLGIDPEKIGYTEDQGFSNVHKISRFDKPTLIIHAELDYIIPFSEGQALFNASPAEDKTLLKISNAGHNDIFYHGFQQYMAHITQLAQVKTG